MPEKNRRGGMLRSGRGQVALGYLLVLGLVALGVAAALTSDRMVRSFSILYTDMAARVAEPGHIDSETVHAEAVNRWQQ